MALLRFLLLFSVITFGGGVMDPNGGTVDGGPGMDPNGGVAVDSGPHMDPNGAQLCYTGCIDPNG